MAFARSVSIVTIINIASALLSVANVSVMAFYFGTSESIEIYFASTLLLTTFLTLANSAHIPDVVLPLYHKVSHSESSQAGHLAFSVVMNWAMLFVLLLITLIYFVLPVAVGILVPGFSTGTQAQVVGVMYWILPLVFFSILVQFFATFVNAESRFGRPEMIALAVKLIGLFCVVVWARSYDYWALVIGLWAGMIFRITSYVVMILNIGYRHKLAFSSPSVELGKVLRQFFSSSGFSFSAQAFQVALNAGVSQLPQGTFAIFNYVSQLSSKTSGIFLKPIALVFFTKASQIVTKGRGGLVELSDRALSLFTLSAIPIILYTFLYGEVFLRVLLGSNRISVGQIELGALVLQVFFGLLIFSGLASIYRKLLLSSGYAELMYWSSSVLQLCAAGVALILLPKYGHLGIIGSLAFSAISITIWLGVLVAQKMGEIYFYNFDQLGRWILTSFIIGLIVSLLLPHSLPLIDESSRLELMIFLGVHSIVYGLLVVLLGLLFRVREIKWILIQISAQIARLKR